MNWPFIIAERALIITAAVVLAYFLSKKNRKTLRIAIIIGVVAFLLYPSKWVYKDGGSTVLWAPVWEHITVKNIEGEILYKQFFLFPNNFKDLGDVKP